MLSLVFSKYVFYCRFEGQISSKNIEIGIIGTHKVFRQVLFIVHRILINIYVACTLETICQITKIPFNKRWCCFLVSEC